MRIAFVYDAVYPWVKGGAEKRIYELGKRLASMGHEVHVFGVKWWDGASMIENEAWYCTGYASQWNYMSTAGGQSPKLSYFDQAAAASHPEKFDI